MLSENKKMKMMGISMLFLSLFLFLPILFVVILTVPSITLKDLSSPDVVFYPSLLFLVISFILISFRYIRNKPLKQNKILGLILIFIGLIWSLYEMIVYVIFYKYLYDIGYFSVPGKVGETHVSPRFIFVFSAYSILLGFALRIFSNNSLNNQIKK